MCTYGAFFFGGGGINVSANTVFSLQFVAIPSSGFHKTVDSVLHNQICRLLSIIKSLVVLLFLFMLPTFSLKPFMS